MVDSEIASAVERGITSQSELITSLSLAVIGGLLVLLLQFRMHNAANPENPVEMHWFPLYCVALTFSGLSIVFGYFLSGMLVQMAPQMFSHAFDATRKFSEQDFGPAPVGRLQVVSLLQFLVFVGAILAGVTFILRNRH